MCPLLYFRLISIITSITFFLQQDAVQEAVQRTVSEMDKEVTKKINTIKKTNALEKKEFIKSFEKKTAAIQRSNQGNSSPVQQTGCGSKVSLRKDFAEER